MMNVTRGLKVSASDVIPALTPDVTRLDWWNCVYGAEDPHTEGFVHHVLKLPYHIGPWITSGDSGLHYHRVSDFWIIIVTTILTAAFRVLTKHYVFPLVAKHWARIPTSNKKKTFKFCYQLWLMTYYLTTSTIGIIILCRLPWWGAPFNCVANAEMWRDHPNRKFPRSFEVFYVAQAGFYVSEFVATIVESRRSDFWLYIWHHLVTLLLILGSYLSLDVRIGSLVFLYHDIPDIFLSSTKVLHYARYDKLTNVSFFCLAVSYFVCRMYMFPGLIYTAWLLPLAWRPDQVWNAINLNFITFGLVPLHFFWFFLIMRMGYRAIFDKTVKQDIRSDSEEEGDAAGTAVVTSPKITQRKAARKGDAKNEETDGTSPTAGGRKPRRED